MKKEEVPQDNGPLSKSTREVCYVKNEEGKYESVLSSGWEVKSAALDSAWEEVNRRIEDARKEVAEGRKSPIFYFMELRLMDATILAAYTNYWAFTIKRHWQPAVFNKLSKKRLINYAKVFEISVEELTNFKG